MKNTKKDIGLEYIQQLGIRASKTANGVFDKLSGVIGRDKTQEILDVVNFRADHQKSELDDSVIYRLKNQSKAGSLCFTGGFDGDIVRNVCNWINEHRDCFGGSILEIGCDIGLISCFLAQQFPESQITSIDRFPEGISIAQEIATELNLTNIRFLNVNANDLHEKYDTVFSCRTLHENSSDVEPWDLFDDVTAKYRNAVQNYANTVSSLVKERGTLISIERTGLSAFLLAWMYALNQNKLVFDRNLFTQIHCSEAGNLCILPAGVYKQSYSISEDTLFTDFCTLAQNGNRTDSNVYFGDDAALVMKQTMGSFIGGFEAYHPSNKKSVLGHMSLWTYEPDDTKIIAYSFGSTQDVGVLYRLVGKSKLNDMLAEQRQAFQSALEARIIVCKLDYINGHLDRSNRVYDLNQ